jgi:cytosine/adenosine deaminase-related metal-dependent hydrolase
MTSRLAHLLCVAAASVPCCTTVHNDRGDDAGVPADHGPSPCPPDGLAIEHVNVLAMTPGATPLRDATVIVRGQRIDWIGPAEQAPIPSGATRLDARGRWLIPGLIDAHVHIENPRLMRLLLQDPAIADDAISPDDVYFPFLAHGITQIGNLGAMSEAIGERRAIEAGTLLGPHAMLAAMVDGDPPLWPVGFSRPAATPEAGRQVVRDEIAEGYDMVKVYSNLTLDTFTAIVDEAHSRGVKVVGHIPGRGAPIEPYFQTGYTMVAHAEEFAFRAADSSDAEVARMVAAAALHGTGMMTTLTVDQRILEQTLDPSTLHSRPELQYVHPLVRRWWFDHNPYIGRNSPDRIAQLRRIVEFNDKLVRAFVAAGLPVLAGTDSLVPGVVAGASLHDELAALVAAGLTPTQALEAATRVPATWMGVINDRGTIELGKRADLVLLDGDPTGDITNAGKIAAVIRNGRWLSRHDLDAKLADLARRYAAAP